MNSVQHETRSPERTLPDAHPLRAVPGGKSPESHASRSASPRPLEDVWDRHGAAIYALACALLCDESAATQAVTRGMIDLARSNDHVPAEDARRPLARHVYWRSQELLGDMPSTTDLPPAMVWVARLAPLQRACLALCCFGGHTHREAAALLEVPPVTVAELLTSGLRELGGSAVVPTASHA